MIELETEPETEKNQLISQWIHSTTTSVSAALIFGKKTAASVSEPLIEELLNIVTGDYAQGIIAINKVIDVKVRRLILSRYKDVYIKKNGTEELTTLLIGGDMQNRQVVRRYDQALLNLMRKHNGDLLLLENDLKQLPPLPRNNALKRIKTPEFENSRRIGLKMQKIGHNEQEQKLKLWHWITLLICLSILTISFTS